MKKVIVSASVIALLAGVLALTGDAWSQSKEPAAAATDIPHKVGLIDMAYVFKNYKKFESLREDLKVEISESEEKAKEINLAYKVLSDPQERAYYDNPRPNPRNGFPPGFNPFGGMGGFNININDFFAKMGGAGGQFHPDPAVR